MFFAKNKAVQTLALTGALLNLSSIAFSIFQTPYVQDYLNSGAQMLSYIKTLSTLSIGIGAAGAPKIKNIPSSKIFFISGVLFGSSFMLDAIAPYISVLWIRMIVITVSMIGMGFSSGIKIVVSGAIKMKVVPLDMMGRITGIYGAIMQTALPVSSFVCSVLVVHLPVPFVWSLFGMFAIVSFSTLFITGRLKYFDNLS